MITGQRFIELMRKKMAEVVSVFRYPQEYFYCVSTGFEGLGEEEREESFLNSLGISENDYRDVV